MGRYHSWSINGRGIELTAIKNTMTMDRIMALLVLAPNTKKKVEEYLKDCGIDPAAATTDDIKEIEDGLGYKGVGTILRDVIKETENVELTLCDDYYGVGYLLFCPCYPWSPMTEEERNMTEDRLEEIFTRYAGILTDAPVYVEDKSVENGS